jgi:hypothetical protein
MKSINSSFKTIKMGMGIKLLHKTKIEQDLNIDSCQLERRLQNKVKGSKVSCRITSKSQWKK